MNQEPLLEPRGGQQGQEGPEPVRGAIPTLSTLFSLCSQSPASVNSSDQW